MANRDTKLAPLSRLLCSTLLAGALGAFAAGPALAAACQTQEEAQATRVRLIQTELMATALKCRADQALGLNDLYGAFVRKFGPDLIHNARVLQTYFKRVYGGDHQRRFDAWITSVSNQASIQNNATESTCQDSPELFRQVLSMTIDDLKRFAADRLDGHPDVKACEDAPAPKPAKQAAKGKTNG